MLYYIALSKTVNEIHHNVARHDMTQRTRITINFITELLSILARPPNFSQYDPYSSAYVPTPSDFVQIDKDREVVPMKKNIPSFSQLSGSQPLPPPPPGSNQGPFGLKLSPTAKRGIPPGIAGKSLSMSSIQVDRDTGNGIIDGNGNDHNGYHTGTANGIVNLSNNGNWIHSSRDDSNHVEYGRGENSKAMNTGPSSSDRNVSDDSSNGNGGTRDLLGVLSPPQGVSVRPSFSRLSMAGPLHHSGIHIAPIFLFVHNH